MPRLGPSKHRPVYVDSDHIDAYEAYVAHEEENLVGRGFVEEDLLYYEVLLECLLALLVEEL